MNILLLVHGLFRWVVVIVGVIALVKLASGLIQRSTFSRLDSRLAMAFSVSMDIQVLLGLLNLISMGFPRQGLEHAFVMILAVIAAHIPSMWRKAADQVRFRNTLIAFVVSLALVFIGVAMLGAWSRIA